MSNDVEKGRIISSIPSKRTDWTSIYISAALSFVGSIQFSLYFSGLWFYMRFIDKEITEDYYGSTVAIYSLGQAISSPAFGAWSNKIKRIRPPLTSGIIMMILGNIIYLSMEIAPMPARYVLLICRFITGMGSGNVAILRSYVSTASHSLDRSKAIAMVTCGQAFGMTIGPIFQYVFIRFEYPGICVFNKLHLNLYTLPAYLALIMNFLGIFCLYTLFVEDYKGIIEEDASSGQNNKKALSRKILSSKKLPMYDIIAVLVCYATRFVDMFVRSQLETLGSPFTMMMFSLNESDAVRYISATQGIVGIITLCINFRKGCIISLVMLFLFHITTYPWRIWPKNVEISNGTSIGCDLSKFKWCNNLPAVNIWLFYAAYIVFIGISLPLLTITLTTLFSKILGPRRQGTHQGFFQSSSSLARIIGPVASSAVYSKTGPSRVWIMELVVIGMVLGSWFLFYTRMVALKIPKSIRRLSRNISKRLSENKH